jgi:tetratricopeptide (TPR) repeat protein
MNLGEYESAIKLFNTVLSKGITEVHFSDFGKALLGRANSYKESKQYMLAISDYTEMIRLMSIYFSENDDLLAMLFSLRGECYRDIEKYTEAFNDLDRAIEIFPSAITFRSRANSYHIRYLRTITTYKDRIQTMMPEERNLIIDLKNHYYERAYSDYENALKIDPNNVAVKNGFIMLKYLREKEDTLN